MNNKRVIIEDNIIIKDRVCAAGSHMLYNFAPPFQATAVDRLLAAGWQLSGQTHVGEFAMGGTETCWFGPTANPLNSGYLGAASAPALAGGLAEAALAVDCGDTLRLAAHSGCVAFRPSYGAVSRFGVIANVSSCEQICALAPQVETAAALLRDVAGHDSKDATSLPQEGYAFTVKPEVKGKRVALVENLLTQETNPQARQAAEQAAAELAAAGARVDRVCLPYLDLAGPAYICMAAAEGCNNISRFDGVKYGYRCAKFKGIEELYRNSRSEAMGEQAKFTALLGAYVLSKGNYEQYYYKALQARRLVAQAWQELFDGYEAALLPLAEGTAYPIDGERQELAARTEADRCWSAPALIAGLPSLGLPRGQAKNGLPLALQIVAARGQEEQALAVAAALEAVKGGAK